MKKRMILAVMMVPLMACASLFSERSGEIFQATREGPGELSLGLFYVGLFIPPLGLATVPAGIAVFPSWHREPGPNIVCLYGK